MSIDELAAKYANMSDVLMDVDEAEGKFLNRSFKKKLYKCYLLFLYKSPDFFSHALFEHELYKKITLYFYFTSKLRVLEF